MLIDKKNGAFNGGEHVVAPVVQGVPQPTYEAELMYTQGTKLNRELATVTIFSVVQQE